MRPTRHGAAYRIERSIAARMGCTEYICACRQCRGARVRRVETIARHHRQHGRDPFLPYPVLVGYQPCSLFSFSNCTSKCEVN